MLARSRRSICALLVLGCARTQPAQNAELRPCNAYDYGSPVASDPCSRGKKPFAPARRVVVLKEPRAQILPIAIGDSSHYAIDLDDRASCASDSTSVEVRLVFEGPAYGDSQAALDAAAAYARAFVGKASIARVALYDHDNPVPFHESAVKDVVVEVAREGDRRRARVALQVDAPAVFFSFDGSVPICDGHPDP